MDIELARANMIESQVRTWEVLDQRVLDLLSEVRREDFVPAVHRGLAFADMEIPIGHGEAMLCPKLEARLLQSLALRLSHRLNRLESAQKLVICQLQCIIRIDTL